MNLSLRYSLISGSIDIGRLIWTQRRRTFSFALFLFPYPALNSRIVYLPMTYQETLDHLFSRLPMFSRIGAAAYKEDLTNTIALCDFLGHPEQKLKTIHIAGTNGKGSVSHMLAAILQSAGYRTGLYTSPHLKDFRERIKINGEMIPEQTVVDFTEKTREVTEKIEPSFFELTVAMAFDHFLDKTDISVIETGLGGRLDSTNVINPEISVITNIGWDHMNLLGDTLEKIAFEKAGIIKPHTPVVIGEFIAETRPVFERIAAEKNAPIHFAEEKRYVSAWTDHGHFLEAEVDRKGQVDHSIYFLDLNGIYQLKNLLTVLEACTQLRSLGWKIDDGAIKKGLKHSREINGLHGRWEMIHQHPTVIVDVAHNVNGMEQLLEQIELMSYRELHLIIGMVKDKDTSHILKLLPASAIYYFTQASIPRALNAKDLQEQGLAYGLKGEVFSDVNKALDKAISFAHADDLIIVCGSVFLAGEVEDRN